MKQFILMNKKTGELGLGCRVQLFDSYREAEFPRLDGYCFLLHKADDYDGWLIFGGLQDRQHPWVWTNREIVDARVEVLGEL